ncbi:uncharacterized protein RHOBADRAFT_43063 [Rhodotorula graminis WP1]|uniref:MYND-type domain-containing protein n=1 Tax=Rhodotorula graminis (strain WP1) TaxID=578459 RepID=A0A194S8A6_RHOGW|nr:uncharacterized protein RHOBADRAFT_43063 [Rhodotorula graminis WP1]KPV75641.1 hypothetical protein RHOBADRAFT_43063 [Rhodotorula graminis WP1]
MASTVDLPEHCIVCYTATTKLCSACRAVRLCSERCQRILWPTHKVLCGRSVDTFYLPPLTADEIRSLDDVKSRPGLVPGLRGQSLVSLVKGGYPGPLADFLWTTFWQRLTAPANDDPYEENERLENVALAYEFLGHAADRELFAGNPPARRSPWQLFAKSCMAFHTEYCEAVAKMSGNTPEAAAFDKATQIGSFTVLNALFRQQLVHATITCQSYNRPSLVGQEEALELVQAGRTRAVKLLEASDLPEFVKQRLVAHAQVGLSRGAWAQSVAALDKLAT